MSSVLATLLIRGETAELYNLLGQVEAELGEAQGAVEHLERAAKLDPREVYVFDLGYQLLRLWSPRAVEVLERGTQQFPQSGRLWMALGSAYFAQARTEQALGAYLRAVENSDDPRAYRLLGAAYLASKADRPDVAERFRRHRLSRPQDAWANFFDGYCLLRAGRAEEALPPLRRAVELDPGLADAHFQLGNLHIEQGRVQEALAAYQAAVQSNPEHQEAYYGLGQAYLRAGRQSEAEAALARHEALGKQQAENNEARRRRMVESIYQNRPKP